MPRTEHSISIDRPPVDVFAVLSDVRNTAKWYPAEVEETWITPEPIGVGSQRHARGRAYGAAVENIAEVTVFDPPHRLGLRSVDSPVPFEITIDLAGEGSGTRVRWVNDLSPSGFLRLVVAATSSLHERQTRLGLRRLKEMMESNEL